MYHVRQLYQNKIYAAGYEKTRFEGIYGRFRNWNTKRVISKLIRLDRGKGACPGHPLRDREIKPPDLRKRL